MPHKSNAKTNGGWSKPAAVSNAECFSRLKLQSAGRIALSNSSLGFTGLLTHLGLEGSGISGYNSGVISTQNRRVAALSLNDESLLAKRIVWHATDGRSKSSVIIVI